MRARRFSTRLIAQRRRGFTIVEAVIVLATVGVLAAIAIPRMSAAGERAKIAQADANERALQMAVDYYTAEHSERSPAINPDGSVTNNGNLFLRRLTMKTDDLGTLDPSGIFGPYLSMAPKNPLTNTATVRIDGAATGAGLAAWRFDSATNTITPDDSTAVARLIKRGKGGLAAVAGDEIKDEGAMALEAK